MLFFDNLLKWKIQLEKCTTEHLQGYMQSGSWIPPQLARVVAAAARSEKPLLCAWRPGLIATAIFSSGGVDAERLDRRSHQSLMLLLSDISNNLLLRGFKNRAFNDMKGGILGMPAR